MGTFFKHIRNYLFNLKIVNLIFRPLCFGAVSEASSCFLLTWIKVLLCRDKLEERQHLRSEIPPKTRVFPTGDATRSPAAPAKCRQVLV